MKVRFDYTHEFVGPDTQLLVSMFMAYGPMNSLNMNLDIAYFSDDEIGRMKLKALIDTLEHRWACYNWEARVSTLSYQTVLIDWIDSVLDLIPLP